MGSPGFAKMTSSLRWVVSGQLRTDLVLGSVGTPLYRWWVCPGGVVSSGGGAPSRTGRTTKRQKKTIYFRYRFLHDTCSG